MKFKKIDVKITYIVVSIIFIQIGCQHSSSKLHEFADVRSVFTDLEIEKLQKISDWFKYTICPEDIMNQRCYERYFANLAKYKNGNLQLPIKSQQLLMEELQIISFNQFWNVKKSKTLTSDSIVILEPIFKGKYLKFLDQLGEKNEKVKFYVDHFRTSGFIHSPTIFADVILNYKEYKIKDERIKLLMAIHCMTVNEIMFIQQRETEISTQE